MTTRKIPIIDVGPGSQGDGEDGLELDYPVLPKEMNTFSLPPLPEPEDIYRAPQVLETLQRLLDAIENPRQDSTTPRIQLSALPPDQLELLNQLLGEGEVSIRVDAGDSRWLIQESVLAGVWRLRQPQTGADWIEVGPIPSLVLEFGLKDGRAGLDLPQAPPPAGVSTATALLVELRDQQAHYRAGNQSHIINLSLLPHSQADLDYLAAQLGGGNTLILSRGYGNCRISATAVANIWWVQYFNSEDSLIVNSLEVVDMPAVAMAAPEDLEDSATRLRELMDLLQ